MDHRLQLLVWMVVFIVPAVLILLLNDWLKRRNGTVAAPTVARADQQKKPLSMWTTLWMLFTVGVVVLAALRGALGTLRGWLAALVLPAAGVIVALGILWIVGKILLQRYRGHRTLGLLARAKQGDMAGALRDAREWADQKPSDPMAWVTLAALYHQQQDWPAAEQAIARYEQLRPQGTELLVNKPWPVARQGRLAEADALYSAAVKDHPDHIGLHMDYCRLLVELGRGDEAIEHFEAAQQRRKQIKILSKEYRDLVDNQLEECRALVAAYSQQHDSKP